MKALFESSRFIGFPKNRYEALDDVQCFFELKGVDLSQIFEILLTCSDGYLIYSFGDIQIQFMRGFSISSDGQNTIQLSIELDNDEMKKTGEYEFGTKDFKLLKRKKCLKDLGAW